MRRYTGKRPGWAGLSSAALHIIAMASMLVDHVMKTVVVYDGWVFVLGRLAFPIFAFLAAEGCFYTKNPAKYGLRLLVFALVSEVPYDLMKSGTPVDVYDQNVIWTFLIAFLCIQAYQRARTGDNPSIYIPIAILSAMLGFLAATIASTDYGGMGVWMVLIFYYLRDRQWWMLALQFVLMAMLNILFLGGLGYGVTVVLFGRPLEFPQQGFAVFALIPIWLYRGRQGFHSKPFQYVCYGFYPVHMLVLALLALAQGG
jgi:hypothetical protein